MKSQRVVFVFAILFASGAAYAEEKGKPGHPGGKHPEPTAEQRQKMASMHEKMAACLKSDRPIRECHEEMHEACKESKGEGGCPMGHMGHHGRGHHGKGHPGEEGMEAPQKSQEKK